MVSLARWDFVLVPVALSWCSPSSPSPSSTPSHRLSLHTHARPPPPRPQWAAPSWSRLCCGSRTLWTFGGKRERGPETPGWPLGSSGRRTATTGPGRRRSCWGPREESWWPAHYHPFLVIALWRAYTTVKVEKRRAGGGTKLWPPWPEISKLSAGRKEVSGFASGRDGPWGMEGWRRGEVGRGQVEVTRKAFNLQGGKRKLRRRFSKTFILCCDS